MYQKSFNNSLKEILITFNTERLNLIPENFLTTTPVIDKWVDNLEYWRSGVQDYQINRVECSECNGTGEVHSHNPKCWTCNGYGWIKV